MARRQKADEQPPKETTGSDLTAEERDVAADLGLPDATKAEFDRLEAVFESGRRFEEPYWIRVVDTGGPFDDAKRERHDRAWEVLHRAFEEILEIFGRTGETPRNLGRYGLIWHADVPVEMQLERECIERGYCERLAAWQEKCVEWRLGEAVAAEAERIREERAKAGKPRRRRSSRKPKGGEQ